MLPYYNWSSPAVVAVGAKAKPAVTHAHPWLPPDHPYSSSKKEAFGES